VPGLIFPAAASRITAPRVHWVNVRKAVLKKPRRIMARRKHQVPPAIRAKPLSPINRMTAEMWEDYRIFKGAGLLSEWRRKWAAYLPEPP